MKKIFLIILILTLWVGQSHAFKLFGLFEIGATSITQNKDFRIVDATGAEVAKISTDGVLTVKQVVVTGTDDEMSKLVLGNNLEDDDVSDYGIRFVGGIPYVRVLGSSIPLFGMHYLDSTLISKLEILPISNNPVTSIHGLTLSYPEELYANSVTPQLPETTSSTGDKVRAFAFSGTGEDYDDVAYVNSAVYRHIDFTSTKATVQDGYLYKIINSVNTLTTDVYSISVGTITERMEIVGEFDVTGTTYTSGTGRIVSNVNIDYSNSFYMPLVGIGYWWNGSTTGSNTHFSVSTGNAHTACTEDAHKLSVGKSTYKIILEIDPAEGHENYLLATVYINNVLVSTWNQKSINLGTPPSTQPLYHNIALNTSSTVTGIASIKDYGWWISWK